MQFSCRHESWPIAGRFTIARGSKTAADVVVVALSADGVTGHGECVPYARYNETVPQVIAALEMRPAPHREADINSRHRNPRPALCRPQCVGLRHVGSYGQESKDTCLAIAWAAATKGPYHRLHLEP